jgi:hypothetical protein
MRYRPGLDRDAASGIDPGSEAFSPTRNFSYSYQPYDPNTQTGGAPVPVPQTYPGSQYQQGTITQLFYICNLYHDELYRLGFTEAARNFQNDNFGRGGTSNDPVSAEAQDAGDFNNANFGTPADGSRGRMQMYLWSGPEPDLDGDLDGAIVIHEYTHGLSQRLHGNAAGLTTNMSKGMGEGWSDFYAHCLLSEAGDPINGIYTIASYATYLRFANYTNNYYYGIRRFPLAVRTFTGGPQNRPHDPLTFKDADATQVDLNRGAYAPGPGGSSSAVDATHNLGEIWASALWEVRSRMVNRLGWAVGNRKALQLVTDGMKLAPLAPTFLTERDAIIAAAQASTEGPLASIDVADFWQGFAARGIGASASIQNPGSGNGTTRVTEAFDLPNLYQEPDLTISDAVGNGNGYPDPGEALTITIPLTNVSGVTATNTSLQIVGGGSASYGNIESGTTVSRSMPYTVPLSAACGSVVSLTLNVSSTLGPVIFVRTFAVGRPTVTYSEAFDSVTAPAIPPGWTAQAVQGGVNFVTTSTTPDSGVNAAFALDPASVGGGTDLTSPPMPITVAGAMVTFRQKYDTEQAWDGGVLEISGRRRSRFKTSLPPAAPSCRTVITACWAITRAPTTRSADALHGRARATATLQQWSVYRPLLPDKTCSSDGVSARTTTEPARARPRDGGSTRSMSQAISPASAVRQHGPISTATPKLTFPSFVRQRAIGTSSVRLRGFIGVQFRLPDRHPDARRF